MFFTVTSSDKGPDWSEEVEILVSSSIKELVWLKDDTKDFNEVNEFSESKLDDTLNVDVVVELIDNVYPS